MQREKGSDANVRGKKEEETMAGEGLRTVSKLRRIRMICTESRAPRCGRSRCLKQFGIKILAGVIQTSEKRQRDRMLFLFINYLIFNHAKLRERK